MIRLVYLPFHTIAEVRIPEHQNLRQHSISILNQFAWKFCDVSKPIKILNRDDRSIEVNSSMLMKEG
jgi:hypothetical protein